MMGHIAVVGSITMHCLNAVSTLSATLSVLKMTLSSPKSPSVKAASKLPNSQVTLGEKRKCFGVTPCLKERRSKDMPGETAGWFSLAPVVATGRTVLLLLPTAGAVLRAAWCDGHRRLGTGPRPGYGSLLPRAGEGDLPPKKHQSCS